MAMDSSRETSIWRALLPALAFLFVAALLFVARAEHLSAQSSTQTPTGTVTATVTATGTATTTVTTTPSATATRRTGVGGRLATTTATPTSASVDAPAATATPTRRVRLALAVLPAPSVKHNLIGDVVSAEDVPVSISYPVLYEDVLDFQMENVRDSTAGEEPGTGIAFVRFLIVDQQGNVVHAAEARGGSPFCAFPQEGYDGEGCPIWDFAMRGNRWPNRTEAHGGRYTLVAFAQGAEPDHKGTWTLGFELRLASEGLGATDGAVRFSSIARTGDELQLEVETFGFTPFLLGTHLHFYAAGTEEIEAVGGVDGIIEYPASNDLPGAFGSGAITISLSDLMVGGGYASEPKALCVAIAHPDESVLVGRGECVAIPE